MDNKFEKIAIGLLATAVFLLGAVSIFQQKAVNQIRSQIQATENTSIVKKASSESANPVAPRISQESIESLKAFQGEVKLVSVDSLDIEAELSKLKNSTELQENNSKGVTLKDFDKFEKTIKVSLNDKTQYSGIKKEDLKAGDKIFVTADNSPFEVDSLTALSIAPWKGQ